MEARELMPPLSQTSDLADERLFRRHATEVFSKLYILGMEA